MRDWLDDQGFLLVDTPIITPAAGEETTTLFDVDYFGENAFLAQTGQLYNEANIMAFGKVYCFGPTFRAEKSKTRRHLIEFWMLEPEIAFCSLEELMDIEEGMVAYRGGAGAGGARGRARHHRTRHRQTEGDYAAFRAHQLR